MALVVSEALYIIEVSCSFDILTQVMLFTTAFGIPQMIDEDNTATLFVITTALLKSNISSWSENVSQ